MKEYTIYYALNDDKEQELFKSFDTFEEMEDFALTSDIHHAAGYKISESKPVLEIC